jgi:hypothetical protein
VSRVTGLCEFSPIVRLFYLGSFLNTPSLANFRTAFTTVKVMYYVSVTTNGLGNLLGAIFISSSGHPVFVAQLVFHAIVKYMYDAEY